MDETGAQELRSATGMASETVAAAAVGNRIITGLPARLLRLAREVWEISSGREEARTDTMVGDDLVRHQHEMEEAALLRMTTFPSHDAQPIRFQTCRY